MSLEKDNLSASVADEHTENEVGSQAAEAGAAGSQAAEAGAKAGAEKPCVRLNEISTQALAYLGDCVIELFVREKLTLEGISSSKSLNVHALRYVSAPKQAEAMKNIMDLLTEQEDAYFRRGRNIGHTNTPKNATVSQYRTATGMETLFGFLHLSGNIERARTLFNLAYKD